MWRVKDLEQLAEKDGSSLVENQNVIVGGKRRKKMGNSWASNRSWLTVVCLLLNIFCAMGSWNLYTE